MDLLLLSSYPDKIRGTASIRVLLSILSLLILLFSTALAAAAADGDVGSWNIVYLKKRLGSRWRITVENQIRFKDDISRLQQYLIRPWILYRLAPHIWIGGGYGWTPTFNPFRNVNVIFQELEWLPRRSSGSLSLRTRIEEMFLQETDMTVRVRQKLDASFPFQGEVPVSFFVSEEVFVFFNSVPGGPLSGFDQNRLAMGAEYEFSKDISSRIGVLNQYLHLPGHNPDLVAFVLLTSLTWKL